MKTIEIKSGDQIVQFTTRSVTLDGKEYLYADITELYHSPVVHTYQFECYGDVKKIVYDKKDAKILNAIFSQVKKLEVQKQETAKPAQQPAPVVEEKPAQQPAPAAEEAHVAETPAEETPAEEKAEEAPAEAEEKVEESEETKEEAKEEATAEEEKAKKTAKETFGSLKARGQEMINKIKKSAKGDTAEGVEGETEKEPMDPEKKERLKKSLRVFGIILAALIVVSVIYYFVFGTPNDPTDTNPTNIESQQYDDIDQLIDDMQ